MSIYIQRWFQYSVEEFEQTTNPDNASVIVMTRQSSENTNGHELYYEPFYSLELESRIALSLSLSKSNRKHLQRQLSSEVIRSGSLYEEDNDDEPRQVSTVPSSRSSPMSRHSRSRTPVIDHSPLEDAFPRGCIRDLGPCDDDMDDLGSPIAVGMHWSSGTDSTGPGYPAPSISPSRERRIGVSFGDSYCDSPTKPKGSKGKYKERRSIKLADRTSLHDLGIMLDEARDITLPSDQPTSPLDTGGSTAVESTGLGGVV